MKTALRLLDYTDRFSRLQILGTDSSHLDKVFDDVCRKVFHSRLSDIPITEYCKLPRLDEEEADAFAEKHGYDLRDELGYLVFGWEAFSLMIQAQAAGLLPSPSDDAERRLRIEAERHRGRTANNGQRGYVKWYDPAKGFGFISRDDGGSDVFVHRSAVEAAGLSKLEEGDTIQFEPTPGKKGECAGNLRLIHQVELLIEEYSGSRRMALQREYRDIEDDKQAEAQESLYSAYWP
jgi:CspA family cold shock protein